MPALALAPQPHQHGGGKIVEAATLEQHLVQLRQQLLRLVDLPRQPSHRVAQRHRNAGGCAALAGDVSDHDPAAVAGGQDVVEVAADLHPLAVGVEDDGDVETRYVRRLGRAQATLQVLRDPVAFLVEAGVVEGERGPVRQLAEQLQVARRRSAGRCGRGGRRGRRASIPGRRAGPPRPTCT